MRRSLTKLILWKSLVFTLVNTVETMEDTYFSRNLPWFLNILELETHLYTENHQQRSRAECVQLLWLLGLWSGPRFTHLFTFMFNLFPNYPLMVLYCLLVSCFRTVELRSSAFPSYFVGRQAGRPFNTKHSQKCGFCNTGCLIFRKKPAIMCNKRQKLWCKSSDVCNHMQIMQCCIVL